MVHVKWPSSSFKVDLDHEIDNIMKNGFYQRILQPSEHPKRVGAKKSFFFFQTLLDGPFIDDKLYKLLHSDTGTGKVLYIFMGISFVTNRF